MDSFHRDISPIRIPIILEKNNMPVGGVYKRKWIRPKLVKRQKQVSVQFRLSLNLIGRNIHPLFFRLENTYCHTVDEKEVVRLSPSLKNTFCYGNC